jgi:hypothetical protein
MDVAHAYAVGKAAVELAVAGHNAVMPAIERTSDKPYRWKIAVAPLSKVANVEKMLPRDFISADGFGITAKARAYLAPLIRGEDYPPYKDGVPSYVRLKNAAVPKKLGTDSDQRPGPAPTSSPAAPYSKLAGTIWLAVVSGPAGRTAGAAAARLRRSQTGTIACFEAAPAMLVPSTPWDSMGDAVWRAPPDGPATGSAPRFPTVNAIR